MDLGFIFKREERTTPNYPKLRTTLYIKFSNSNNVIDMCERTIAEFRSHLRQNVLKYDQEENDILDVLVDTNKWEVMGDDEVIMDVESVEVEVKNKPLFQVINIPSDIALGMNMRTAHGDLTEIGCQHIISLTYVTEKKGSASSLSSASSDTDGENRTCKRAKVIKCPDAPGLFQLHKHNEEIKECTTVYVDILIYCFDQKISEKLSKFFGLVFLDKIVAETKEKNIDHLLRNKSAKIYKLLQTMINKELIYGASNICLTTSEVLFENIKANFKSIIIREVDKVNALYTMLQTKGNHTAHISGADGFFGHTQALTEIINEALMTDACVLAYFKRENNQESHIYKVNIPLISIVPLHVLRYVAQKNIMEKLCQQKIELF